MKELRIWKVRQCIQQVRQLSGSARTLLRPTSNVNEQISQGGGAQEGGNGLVPAPRMC